MKVQGSFYSRFQKNLGLTVCASFNCNVISEEQIFVPNFLCSAGIKRPFSILIILEKLNEFALFSSRMSLRSCGMKITKFLFQGKLDNPARPPSGIDVKVRSANINYFIRFSRNNNFIWRIFMNEYFFMLILTPFFQVYLIVNMTIFHFDCIVIYVCGLEYRFWYPAKKFRVWRHVTQMITTSTDEINL